MSNKPKKKKRVSNIMLVVVCVMIILFTAACFVVQYTTSVEISSTLTTAWFSFWSVEILALMGIRVSKVIKGEGLSDGRDPEEIDQDNMEE